MKIDKKFVYSDSCASSFAQQPTRAIYNIPSNYKLNIIELGTGTFNFRV